MPPEDEDDERPYATRDELSVEPSLDMDAATHQNLYLDQFGAGSNTPIITDPVDGLPRPADDVFNPAPSLEKSICIEDKSAYVEAFKDEADIIVAALGVETEAACSLVGKLKMSRVVREAAKERFREDGTQNLRETFSPDTVSMRYGVWMVGNKPVRPKRLQCSLYFSQEVLATDVESTSGPARPRHSFCKALRSSSGAFFGLMDETILSCEERRPVDEASVKKLRDRIRLKVVQSKERTNVPMVPMADKVDIFQSASSAVVYGDFRVACDPEIKPGGFSLLSVCSPKAFEMAGSQGIRYTKLIVVGTGWMPDVEHLGKAKAFSGRPDTDYHTVLVSPKDYSDQGMAFESKKEFLEAWPSHAAYPYLESSLRVLPQAIVSSLRRGESVVIVAEDKAEAVFLLCLVDNALAGSKSTTRLSAYETFYDSLKHEHLAYLNRA